MTSRLDDSTAAKRAAELAREWARRTVLGIVIQSGGQAALGLGGADVEPLPGLLAASELKFAVRRLTVEYARLARDDDRSWREIRVALGLKDMADAGVDVADAAYEHLAGTPTSWRPAFVWVYPASRSAVLDHGPQARHPADCDDWHAGGCPRLASAVTAWHAASDNDGGQP